MYIKGAAIVSMDQILPEEVKILFFYGRLKIFFDSLGSPLKDCFLHDSHFPFDDLIVNSIN